MRAVPSRMLRAVIAFGGAAALCGVLTVLWSMPEGEPTPEERCLQIATWELEGEGLEPSVASTVEVAHGDGSIRSWTVTGQVWSVATGTPDRPLTCAIDDMDGVWRGSVDVD